MAYNTISNSSLCMDAPRSPPVPTKRFLLADTWRAYKEDEEDAKAGRLAIEREMVESLNLPEDHEGVSTINGLAITHKMSVSVDTGGLKELQQSGEITNDRLGEIFRWKPSINSKAWGAATEQERAILSKAITTKPAKPGFKDKE